MDFPVKFDPGQEGSGFKGGTDAFVIDIFYHEDPSTTNYVTYATCLGGSGDDYGTGIVLG